MPTLNSRRLFARSSGKSLQRAIACLAVTGLVFAPTVQAANQTWNSTNTSQNWSDITNWGGNVAPGSTAVLTSTDIATFNTAVGAIGGSSGLPILIDSATQGIGGLTFDTAASSYFVGLSGGNSLLVTTGGSIQIASTLSSTNAVETISAAVVIEGAGGNYAFANNSANGAGAGAGTFTFAGNVSGGTAGATVLNLNGTNTNNNLISGIIANGTATTLAVVKNGAGTWNLTGVNTYTGGVTLNAGTLIVGNAATLGNTAVGAITINGGTLDTNGAAITTTTAKAQNWNGDFTLTGGSTTTHDLSFNGGIVTLGGVGTTRTVTVATATSTLTEGSVIGAGYGITKAGPGILTFGTAIGRITGDLNITGGTFIVGADFYAGGLTGTGTVKNGPTAKWLFVQNNGNETFSGNIQNGAAGALGLNKSGSGTLTLTGTANNYTDVTTMAGGTIEYGSSAVAGITQTHAVLGFTAGAGTIQSTLGNSGTNSLTFTTLNTRSAGATGNFVVNGGTNGTTNAIKLTRAAGYIDHGTFFNGSSYAYMNAVNTYVRGIAYGSDAGAVTSGTTASLVAATHQEFTGDITAQTTATFTTLKDTGNNNFTLAAAASVTTNGILKSGNVAGGATISGGAGILPASGIEFVIRTDGPNDALNINTPILASGTSGLTTSGAGTLTLSAANTFTGTTTINSNVNLSGSLLLNVVKVVGGGTLNLTSTGSINSANLTNGQITVGSASGGNAILNVNGGTLRQSGLNLLIGGGTGTNNASAFLTMSSGTISTTGQTFIGNTSNAGSNNYAAFTMTGGNFTSGSYSVVGFNNDRSVLNQSGGTYTVSTNFMTIGAGGSGSVGVANFSNNATFTSPTTTFMLVGENGVGTLNVSGNALLTIGNLQTKGVSGTINLLGGTIKPTFVSRNGGIGTFNFNGGKLQAGATGFTMGGLTNAYVYNNSGTVVNTIDNNGVASMTISQALLAPTGNGVNGVASFTGGAGYVDQPIVTVVRNASDTTGTGATAVANVAGGVVTGITITNPGVGYTAAPTFSLFGGGYTTAATITGAAPTANTSGGLVFIGSGTTILTGQSAGSYTGGTTVSSGTTLQLTGANNGTGIIRGVLNINAGGTVNATTANAIGYLSGQSVTAANISGMLNTSAVGDQGFNTTYNLTGGTLTSNGGVSSAVATSYWVMGRINAGTPDVDAINTLASSTVSTIAGRLHLRNDNGQTNVTFTTATGTVPGGVDLLVSAAITDGGGSVGIIKAGTGTMSLTGANTFVLGGVTVNAGTLAISNTNAYAGATTINGGTLNLSGVATINSSSGITVSGSGAKLLHLGSVVVTPAVTLTQGTLDGTGTLTTVNVANAGGPTGAIINNGNGTTSPLNIGSLTFNGAATVNLSLASTSAGLVTTTALASNVAGQVTINATNPTWNNGSTYDLISYAGGSIGGAGFAGFTKGTISGIGVRQNATLVDTTTAVALAITGDLPIWTGVASANWTSTPVGTPFNWKKQSDNSPTEFFAAGDTPLFDDSATGTTAVNIAGADVNPTSTTFNNSVLDYSVSSTGGFGIASGSLIKNGTKKVTLSTAFTSTGGTTINNGTLALGASNVLADAGPVNVTGGTFDVATFSDTVGVVTLSGGTIAGTTGVLTATSVTATNAAGTTTISAILGGSTSLAMNGAGNLSLTGANSHTGGTTVNSGTLTMSVGGTLGTVTNPVTVTGTLDLGTTSQTTGAVSISAGTIQNGTLTGASFASTNAGTISAILAGPGSLTKTGSGTLVLSGPSTYSGLSNLNVGTVSISAAANLGNASATNGIVFGGGTLESSANTYSLGSNRTVTLTGTGTVQVDADNPGQSHVKTPVYLA